MKKEDDKYNQQGQELRSHLKGAFQKMQPKEAAPETLKKQVFGTLDTIQLVADMADLFTVKFTQTESQLVELLDETQLDEPIEKPDDESSNKEEK
ncbi:MAG: hypothetical protein K9J37_14790 [Saprospiraceae bacterium]|nr:hypothetical protein [Saprospiraceae bacterium]MCF8251175.1 hypothetical protein [Saprospiraceae bacterium]MCF8281898.1 hypothetical protein [Bacteroidales bacterium]MCF8312987.1 hypothetical protein [Saprospiraceae bacterium]MCF8441434.1 hypothetical protein [Saprospiraceae bacterium]